jgi:hypothetical protein
MGTVVIEKTDPIIPVLHSCAGQESTGFSAIGTSAASCRFEDPHTGMTLVFPTYLLYTKQVWKARPIKGPVPQGTESARRPRSAPAPFGRPRRDGKRQGRKVGAGGKRPLRELPHPLYFTSPPTIVNLTFISLISFGLTALGSCSSTTRSARLPFVIVPRVSSSKEA